MATKRIPLTEASNAQLLHHAGVILQIDGIKKGQTGSFLIGKIMSVAPDTTDIEVEEEEAQPEPVAAVITAESSREDIALSDRQNAHHRFDPKVKVHIGQDYNGSKVRDVQLSVNGQTITVQRGQTVDLPYRFFLTLDNAKETIFVDTDETHPQTGMPIKEAIQRPTVAHSVVGPLPSPEQIAQFHRRTDHVSM